MIAKSQRWQLTAIAAAALMGLWGTHADALSLGRINVQSSLGEPLKAEIEILDINADEAATLNARVAPPEAFKAAGLDFNPAMSSLQATLQRRPNGRAFLKISSDRAISEPFVDMILEASWNTGRIVRDYTMLFDPPGLSKPADTAITPAQAARPEPARPAPSIPRPTPAAPPTPIAQPKPEAKPPRAPSPAPVAKPAPAPQPQAQAEASDKTKIVVKTGQTASRIADGNKPANVSLDQMLVALLRANPNAFIGDNVNRLKAGAVVTLPTETEAAATGTDEARQIIMAQSQDFNAFRRKLASNAPTTQVTPAGREVTGKLQASVDDKKPSATTPDKLTLSKGAVTAKDKASEDQLAQARNAKETADRAAELAKNLQDLSKLAAASSAGTAASEPAPAALPALPSPQAAEVAASATATTTAAPAASEAVSNAAVASTTAVASAPAKPTSAMAPALPPVAEEPGFVDGLLEDPLVPAGALGLIALLAGFGLYRARQRKKAVLLDSTFGESRLQPESFFGNSGGKNIDTNDSAATGSSMIYSPSQLDAVDDVDPVAEADVYLAYGRDLQAEEILKDALRTRPERLAIHQKMLEIYAKRHDIKAFEAIATLAFNLTNGVGQEWEQICEKGLALDPDNALYLPGGQPVMDAGATTRPAGFDSILPGADAHQGGASANAAPPNDVNADLDLDLDFSLDEPDFSDLPEMTSAKPTRDAQTTDRAPLSMTDESFDALTEPFEPAAPVVTPEPTSGPASASIPLDYPSMALEDDSDNNAFDKTQVLTVPTAKDKPAADSGMMEFDLGSLSLDFAITKPGELTDLDDVTSPIKPDADDEPVTQAGAFNDTPDDPLETKLALAEEFKAIGDDDGARALIEEVISEATGDMKAKAQRALNSL